MKYPETLQLASAAQSTPGLFKEFALEGVAAPCDSTVQTGEKYREISIEFKSNNYGHKSTISFLTDIKVKEQTSNCISLVCPPPTVAEKSTHSLLECGLLHLLPPMQPWNFHVLNAVPENMCKPEPQGDTNSSSSALKSGCIVRTLLKEQGCLRRPEWNMSQQHG